MHKAPDRKKMRREYLKRKSTALASAGIAGTAVVPCAVLAVFLTAFALVLFLTFCLDLIGNRPQSAPLLVAGFICLGFGLLNAIIARQAWLRMRKSRQELAHLTYVPPITPDTLPADEILVRGAEQPAAAQSAILLRAATGEETPQEELLRPEE